MIVGSVIHALSEREVEVLRRVADGEGSKEIGAAMFISPETVKSHRRHATQKLRARNSVHAVAVAMRQGILE